MAYDKVVDSTQLDADLTKIANACRKIKTKSDYDALVDMAVGDRKITISLDELLDGLTTIGAKAFMSTNISGSIVIPEGITTIDYEAFMYTQVTSITFPKTFQKTTGDGYTFVGTALISVTFKAKPVYLHNNIFNSCTSLLDIYVPWAEGEVENAPWGATNATIHYNSEVE